MRTRGGATDGSAPCRSFFRGSRLPPLARPGDLPLVSSISPVVILATITTAPITSRGERWACEIDLRGARTAPAACAALCAAAGGRRAAADVDRLLVAIGRCWRRRGSAPRAGDDGPPRSSVRPTRHSPPHGDIDDDDVAAAAAGRAARFSYGVLAKAWC